jgi:magnesium-transporting ATPase (P-type)
VSSIFFLNSPPSLSFYNGQEILDLSQNPCDYFSAKGKVKASSLSLSVLVMIEMLNAFNALSENGSLVQMPPWRNPYLILACAFSTSLHAMILYVPQLASIFGVGALTLVSPCSLSLSLSLSLCSQPSPFTQGPLCSIDPIPSDLLNSFPGGMAHGFLLRCTCYFY